MESNFMEGEETRASICLFSTSRVPCADYSGREREMNSVLERKQEEAPWWLRAFANRGDRSSSMQLYRFHPKYFTMKKFRTWKEKQWREADILSQAYVPERHTILGSDLAAAHFIVYRGGKVKFVGKDNWFAVNEQTKRCLELPTKYVRGWYVEAIDASETSLRYEGLVNLVSMKKLKWMRVKNCPNVDNWFVDRITGEFGDSLEYLDLSGCKVTEEMLSCMYRCPNLKELNLTGVASTPSFQLGCLMLEDAIPGLTVTGVEYLTPPSESDLSIEEAKNS